MLNLEVNILNLRFILMRRHIYALNQRGMEKKKHSGQRVLYR